MILSIIYLIDVFVSKHCILFLGLTCEDASWADTVAYLSAPQNDGSNSGRPWTYQTCNEFGYYQTTDSVVRLVSSLAILWCEYICICPFTILMLVSGVNVFACVHSESTLPQLDLARLAVLSRLVLRGF